MNTSDEELSKAIHGLMGNIAKLLPNGYRLTLVARHPAGGRRFMISDEDNIGEVFDEARRSMDNPNASSSLMK